MNSNWMNYQSEIIQGVIHRFVVQSPGCVQLFVIPWTAVLQASLSFTIYRSLLIFISIESVMPFNHLIFCFPLLLLPSIFPSIMSWPFIPGGQSIGASASASVLSMNIQDWFPLVLTGWISLQSKGLSRVFSNTTIWKYQFFSAQPSLWSSSLGTSLVAQTVKRLPTVWETWVWSVSREDPL